MIQFEADKVKNLLKVSYSRHVSVEEVIGSRERLETLLAGLQPDFQMLTDMSAMESMDTACAPHIEKFMELFNRKNLKSVVRVIPDPHKDIGLNIMSLFHYRRQVRIVTVETLEAALKILEAESPAN